jgi:hypothetical protein
MVAMGIEAVKRWQWAVVGLVMGLFVSFWRGTVSSPAALQDRTTLEPIEFERLLSHGPHQGKALIRDIAVHAQPDGSFWVTAEQLLTERNRRPTDPEYMPVRMHAPTPYVARVNPPANAGPKFTVVDYLKTVRAKNPAVNYATRWWDRNPTRTILFAGLGLALLGGAWPMLIARLSGGVPVPADRPGKPEPKRQYHHGAPEPEVPLGRRAMTAQELDKLHEVEAELERNLAGRDATEAGAAPSQVAGKDAASHPVRQLTAGPLESTAPEKPVEEKHYAGEFYPTVTHVPHEKKDGDKPDKPG